MKENGVFSIEPLGGVVPAREKMILTVTALLDDSARYIYVHICAYLHM